MLPALEARCPRFAGWDCGPPACPPLGWGRRGEGRRVAGGQARAAPTEEGMNDAV